MNPLNIAKSREGRYILLFSVQMLICLALLSWHEVANVTMDGMLATTIAIGQGIAPFVIVVTAETFVIIEGGAMLAERYLKRRFDEGRAEGRTEGRAEGRTEGRAEGRTEGRTEGRAEMQARWEEWNRRREEALAQNRPFDEPPPSMKDE